VGKKRGRKWVGSKNPANYTAIRVLSGTTVRGRGVIQRPSHTDRILMREGMQIRPGEGINWEGKASSPRGRNPWTKKG